MFHLHSDVVDRFRSLSDRNIERSLYQCPGALVVPVRSGPCLEANADTVRRVRSLGGVVEDDPRATDALRHGLEERDIVLSTKEDDRFDAVTGEHAEVPISVPHSSALVALGCCGERDVVVRREEVRGQEPPASRKDEHVFSPECVHEFTVNGRVVELPCGQEPHWMGVDLELTLTIWHK